MADSHAQSIFGQIRDLSTTATSTAMSFNLTWPFVTLPHFILQAEEAIQYADAELVLFCPLVSSEDVSRWDAYSIAHQDWIKRDLQDIGINAEVPSIAPEMYSWPHDVAGASNVVSPVKVPLWQMAPIGTNVSLINLDLTTQPSFQRVLETGIMHYEHVLLSQVVDVRFLYPFLRVTEDQYSHPRSYVVQPVMSNFVNNTLVGFMIAVLEWDAYFVSVLPEDTNGIVVSVKDTCGSSFTYIINGREAVYLGEGDLHDPAYNDINQTYSFAQEATLSDAQTADTTGPFCDYTMTVYASATFEQSYRSTAPIVFSTMIVVVFIFTMLVFMVYDLMVGRRAEKVHSVAHRTNAMIGLIFPKNVQDRIMKEAQEQAEQEAREKRKGHHLNGYLGSDGNEQAGIAGGIYETKPIADFFPETTIVFADIVGFTAWSSMRDPAQVFTLLETIYHAFDDIARRRRVFKVETVGECYVAVAGLPQPRKDHAIVMARYSRDCLMKFHSLTKKLELMLGPDTTDLALRIGMHSGPVTAGVLRGERSRFQLFGDTVNTASRLETTGDCGKIHVSAETARILNEAGKGHWLRDRKTKVTAKGKGELQTFWLDLREQDRSSSSASGSDEAESRNIDAGDAAEEDVVVEIEPEEHPEKVFTEKQMRLIDWVKDVMATFLKEIAAKRVATNVVPDPQSKIQVLENNVKLRKEATVLDEFQDVIAIPKFEPDAGKVKRLAQKIVLGQAVEIQLRDYVHHIAMLYNDNPFHNFERATHVTMSVVKLLSRIASSQADEDSKLLDHSYGITSYPLTQFAVVFAALIHDVDHPGVSNEQLIKENSPLVKLYDGKHIEEHHSIDVAWNLLMEPKYDELRRAIYVNEAEFTRFRQICVNMMLASDNSDPHMNELRAKRWDEAFKTDQKSEILSDKEVNHRATLVLEHLIQASDVSHTMQHWHIFCKWNTRLFQETYKAYLHGREAVNPADKWYKDEINFFDCFVIPLARNLKESGVFGGSSDEYLNYAERNREEWELKGEAFLEELLADADEWAEDLSPEEAGKGLNVNAERSIMGERLAL